MKKIDGTDKILYFLLAALILFGVFIFINQKYGLIGNKYEWSNGATTFTVYKIKNGEVNFYRIPVFFDKGNEYYPLTLRYGPREVDDIAVEGSPKEIIRDDQKLFLSVAPIQDYTVRTAIGMKEIEEVLVSKYFYGKPVEYAVTQEYGNKTIATCSDAKPMNSVIWFTLGDTTKVHAEGDCIVVQGTTEDEIVRAADRLVLNILGISP
ncbi:MAG: hypothetical protein ABIB71_01415 [Candidatus Woesearchaeota archaeon]